MKSGETWPDRNSTLTDGSRFCSRLTSSTPLPPGMTTSARTRQTRQDDIGQNQVERVAGSGGVGLQGRLPAAVRLDAVAGLFERRAEEAQHLRLVVHEQDSFAARLL